MEFPISSSSEILVVCEILSIVLSIQPIRSRAPGDETYELHWNPVWEPSDNNVPFWDYSVPPTSSDMGDMSPTKTDESVATSGEIPTATESIPVSSSPTTRNLPPGYRSLRDAMSSGTPVTSSIWSPLTFPTKEPFTPQGRDPSVTSITTTPTVCVASWIPVSNHPMASLFRVFEPITNVLT